jgi:hypothetical protein
MVDLIILVCPQAIFFFVSLDYYFLSVDNMTVAWKLFMIVSSADVLSSFSSFLVYLFVRLPCP